MALSWGQSQAVSLSDLPLGEWCDVVPEVVVVVEGGFDDGSGGFDVLVVLSEDLVVLVGDGQDLHQPVAVSRVLVEAGDGLLVGQPISITGILLLKLALRGGLDLLQQHCLGRRMQADHLRLEIAEARTVEGPGTDSVHPLHGADRGVLSRHGPASLDHPLVVLGLLPYQHGCLGGCDGGLH